MQTAPVLYSSEPPHTTQPLILHLLDIPVAMGALGGVVMELQDCALPLIRFCEIKLIDHDCETPIRDVVATDDPNVAFKVSSSARALNS